MSALSYSIVINTDNRIDYLKRTLCGLRFLDYEAFEVCVVAGPTPDGTREFLDSFGSSIKVAHCEERNLSKSRNIGIALATGDVIVFIDDDAVPEPEWLRQLAESFTDQRVGGAGGFVYDNTGVAFQARYVTVNRLGYPTQWSAPAPHLCFPFTSDIPHLLGTNCAFRRSALEAIGGFDEEYEYFLDETDVCCRLVDAGYLIAQRPDAFVHHKFAPSHMRDERKVVRHWYPLIKNRVYFGMRHAQSHHSQTEIVAAGEADTSLWARNVEQAARDKIYSAAELQRFYAETREGVEDGYVRALEPPKLLTRQLIEQHRSDFVPFPTLGKRGSRLTICFVTQDYPPGQNGGIARHFAQYAKTMADAGHHVHVLTKSAGPASVDYEDGVWVHRVEIRKFQLPATTPISPLVVPGHIWDYTQTMLEEVRAIDARRKVDAVYCPLWDCEPLGFLIDPEFPVVLALQTTMKFWLDSQPLKAADKVWMRTFGDPIIAMEEYILETAPLLHANSRAIVRDIRSRYEAKLPDDRVHVTPHCLADWSEGIAPAVPSTSRIRLLFVGRLESRKGIDVVLAAIPDVLEQFPEAVLDIVGDDTIIKPDGSTYKRDFLKRPLPESISSRITFHGRVEEQELREFYRDCDIFVAPSRYESFGLVFLEAMMFGKPVIGCDAGGGPEVVTEGVTGLLVAPGDVEGLKTALVELLEDQDLRQRMGVAARADYERRFTISGLAADLAGAIKLHLRKSKVGVAA